MPTARTQPVLFLEPENLLQTGFFNRVERVVTEAAFTPDYQNGELQIEEGSVLVNRETNFLRANVESVSVDLIPNTTNEVYLGIQNTASTVLTTQSGAPVWPAVKIGEVDTAAEESSTVSADLDVVLPGDMDADGWGIFNLQRTHRQASPPPEDPAPGNSVEWLTDGSGPEGDEGDLMIKITRSDGVTKTKTIVRFGDGGPPFDPQ